MERSIPTSDLESLRSIDRDLSEIESLAEFAAGLAGGKILADRMAQGRPPEAGSPPDRRLSGRLYDFVQKRVDKGTFLALIREWAGEDAVEGSTCVMDPALVAPMSVWLVYDRILPGQDRRGIDGFAEEEANNLPPDEQALLGLWRQDRPSLYRIESIQPGECYDARDLLDADVLRVQDRMSSKTLTPGAILLARFVPFGLEVGAGYGALGTLSEVPPEIWPRLKEFVEEIQVEHRKRVPEESALTFFRRHHARIQRRLRELAKAWPRVP
jgi:hypothetical protein